MNVVKLAGQLGMDDHLSVFTYGMQMEVLPNMFFYCLQILKRLLFFFTEHNCCKL